MNEYYPLSPHNDIATANVHILFVSPVTDNFKVLEIIIINV